MIQLPKKFNVNFQQVLMVLFVVTLGVVVINIRAAGVIGDLNNDGLVNVLDLSILLSDWGTNNATADLNHDGIVNVFDLSTLLSHWGQTAGTPTPTPSATPTPTPTPSPTPSTGFNTCTNPTHTIPMDPNNAQSGVTLNGFYVTNDTWNISAGGSGAAQTLFACDFNNWYVMATEPNTTSVKTYPNVHEDFNEPLISSFHTISSTYAETGPHIGDYEYAYDMWLNGVASGNSTEVMIWNDNFNQTPGGTHRGTFTDGGQTYDVYSSGTSCAGGCYIAFVAQTNTTSGTVNILDFYNYIMNTKSWIPNTSTIGQIDYGVEICETNNVSTKFELNNFSLTTN